MAPISITPGRTSTKPKYTSVDQLPVFRPPRSNKLSKKMKKKLHRRNNPNKIPLGPKGSLAESVSKTQNWLISRSFAEVEENKRRGGIGDFPYEKITTSKQFAELMEKTNDWEKRMPRNLLKKYGLGSGGQEESSSKSEQPNEETDTTQQSTSEEEVDDEGFSAVEHGSSVCCPACGLSVSSHIFWFSCI
jgi:hypothetical protein